MILGAADRARTLTRGHISFPTLQAGTFSLVAESGCPAAVRHPRTES